MKAKYIIQTENEIIEFEAEALNFNKCLQITRIDEAKKKWKGYELSKMEFGLNGLIALQIRFNTTIYNQYK